MPPSRPILAFLLLVLIAPLASTARAAPVIAPDASTFTLENGLVGVVIPDHRAPVVTHMLWYKTGSIDDPPGKSGIAHFLEHLMFKGTSNHPAGAFSARVAELGGNENAFTTFDTTAYHQTVAREHLGLMMEYEADRMANLVIDEAAIATERQVIIEERRSRTDNEPAALLSEAMAATLYQNSHYGIPIIGWAHEMATLDRADALAFYERYYRPDNAVLVVAGDVTVDEVRRLAEATYGKLPRPATPLSHETRASEPRPLASRTVSLSDRRVSQPVLRRLYLVPSAATAAPGEPEALAVLAEILAGGTTSRLYRSLVVEQSLATSVNAGYGANALQDSSFSISSTPRGEVTLEDLEASIDTEIARLAADGISDAELAAAQRRMVTATIYAQDSHAALARMFGQALVTGSKIKDLQEWPARIDAVTKEAVVAAARQYLTAQRSVTGYLVGMADEERT